MDIICKGRDDIVLESIWFYDHSHLSVNVNKSLF